MHFVLRRGSGSWGFRAPDLARFATGVRCRCDSVPAAPAHRAVAFRRASRYDSTRSVTLGRLATLIDELRSTRSRTKKVERVAAFLRELTPEEIRPAVAFLAGRPFPASDPRTLDASFALLREAAGGKKAGRPNTQPPHPTLPFDEPVAAPRGAVTLGEVATAFDEVAAASGPRSKSRKVGVLSALFRRADERERAIVFAIVQGSLRSGVHEGLLLEAIAHASGATPDAVRRAALFLGDAAAVAHRALTAGAPALDGVTLTPFVPVAPMLAQPAESVEDAWAALGGSLAVETKYDGVRLQLHKDGDGVRVWSRRLTELTAVLPEAVAIGRTLPARSAVLDGEVLALQANGRPLPFQETMSRLSPDRAGETGVALAFRFFDLLFLDGRALVDEPYEARRAALERLLPPSHLSERRAPSNPADVAAFFAYAIEAGHEGLIAKSLASPYEPGRRGGKWLKVKPADTVDCVIIAADRGSGRREGWLSNHHLAVLHEGAWAPVGKTFKGLTDAEHEAMTARLRALAIADDGYTVTVRPEIVVEVAFEGIQKSPHLSSGFALRFARITRVRDDKRPDQATTLSDLTRLWQRHAAGSGAGEG